MERVDLVKSEYLMAIFKIPLFKSYSTFVTRMLVGKASRLFILKSDVYETYFVS